MRLFKYLHPDRVDVLRDKRLCFSSPKNLNDPFELNPPLKLYDTPQNLREAALLHVDNAIRKQIDSLPPHLRAAFTPTKIAKLRSTLLDQMPSSVDVNMPMIQQRFNAGAAKHIGVLCLTEQADDLLMWAHYANSHEGFVVEFDPSSSFFHGRRSDSDELRHLRQVIYSDVRPHLVMNAARSLDPFLTKSLHWSYEREWRMMVSLADANDVKLVGEKQYHLFSFPSSAILSVTFGCRMSVMKRDEILEALQADPSLAGIPLYQASPDQSLFRLNIDRVSG